MKNLLITNENIFYIYGVVSKIIQGKQIKSQHFYPNYKRLQQNCNRIGYDNGFMVIQSNPSKFNVVESQCQKLSGKYFMNFNNNVLNNDPYNVLFDWTLPTFKAIVIKVGQKITIKNNVIYLSYTENYSQLYGFKTPRKIIHKINVIS